jgi:methylmalonyl-CoA carboxyltransferase large subunit
MKTIFESQQPGLTVLVAGVVAGVVGSIAGYLAARSGTARLIDGLRAEFEEKFEALSAKLGQAAVPAGKPAVEAKPTAVAAPVSVATLVPAAAAPAVSAPEAEVSEEVLLVIAAAVTVYLGKKTRVRSARMLQSPYEIVNPWAQQGRVFVQASHNITRRGR